MAEFLCLAFECADAADKALNELRAPGGDGLAELADACVARRNAAGVVQVKQSVDLVVGGIMGGSVLGVACGEAPLDG
jgi:uncharacterized membrane protein